MKLFLSSQAISEEQAPHFIRLVGKPAKNTKLAVIENAADVEDGSKAWLIRNRRMIESHGFDVEYVDLRKYKRDLEALHQKLAHKEALWFSGGNTYYLRWLLRDTGIENIIIDLVRSGIIYGGGSAGSIVVGPTLKHFEAADDPSKAPEVFLNGLNFTDKVVLPHMDSEKYAPIMSSIDRELRFDGYQTVPLTDTQALVIDGVEEKVI